MTMRAVSLSEFGDADVLRLVEHEEAERTQGDVLVEVRAAAVSHQDLRVRRGEYPYLPLPLIPGCDVAGVRTDTGDRVVVYPVLSCGTCAACNEANEHLCREARILGVHLDGGYAERISVPARNAVPVPDAWDHAEWAAVPLVFLTAWHALVTRANLRVGEAILIHSAGSGIGSAAVQIASAGGARVIATASSDDKLERALALGAHEAVNYNEVDFADAVRDLTSGAGVQVVLDHVGGVTFEESLTCLTRGGRLVCCGETGHPSATVALRPLFNRERSILGAHLGSRKEFLDVLTLLGQKTLRPVVDATFPLTRAAEAHRYLEERHAFGKVVLTI
ncbi:MAG: zinc-binding dehydrogenase [Planctomycetota bacterium]|jgi:NADPH:quinone reductase-like Zn-dependent oxidoreductase